MPRPTKLRGRRQARTVAAPAQPLAPELQARLADLLAAGPDPGAADDFAALSAEAPGGMLAVIEALASTRDDAAGPLLAALAVSAPDKEQRKAARRALHKLRSAGVAVAIPVPAEPAPIVSVSQEPFRPIQTFATGTDGVGSRVLWLLLERPGGGLLLYYFALNDVVGIKDFMFEETTRRRVDRRLADWDDDTSFKPFELPLEYGLSLISEGLALNRESQFPLPREFVVRRHLLGELPPPPEAALIHQHVSRGQIFLLPNLLEESAELLEIESELASWGFSYKESEPFARDFQLIEQSRLVLTSEPREARLERILESAVNTLMTPPLRRGMKRRLEETAYVFWQSGRERSARQAVAAAFAIAETGSLGKHPLLRAIVQRSIDMAIDVDESGFGVPPGANRTAYDPI